MTLATAPATDSCFRRLSPPRDAQTPYAVTVVLQTAGRPSLLRAVRSVLQQDLAERLQLLIGVDTPFDTAELEVLVTARCPPRVDVSLFYPGYSTSRRHGGLSPNFYGGALRTILSYTANSPYVAYLDDDDWWGANHLATLLQAVAGKAWAFSRRWLVDEESGWPICPDEWDSVGPGKGINAERFGGFVSPSNLLISREAFHLFFPLWSLAAFDDGSGEDRLVFNELRQLPWADSETLSCFYSLRPAQQQDLHHRREFEHRGLLWPLQRDLIGEMTAQEATARRAAAAGAWTEVRQQAQALLARAPHHAGALGLLAEAEWQAGRREEGIDLLCQSLAIDDREPAPYLLLAEHLQALGATAEAAHIQDLVARRFNGG